MIDNSGFWYDYQFRACPVPNAFPAVTLDPAYLCDGFGTILAWLDGTVIVVA